MAEIWGINDPVVDDEEEEIWGINDPIVEDEEDQEEVWGINDPVIEGGETPEAEPVTPPVDIVKQYGEVSERYNQKGKALTQASERFQQLATQPERTPEEEEELAASWKATVRGQADISQDAVELKRLQPEYDKYFADQKQARIDYIEDRRGSGVFGDEAAEALYDIDARAEQEYAQARTIEDADKRKEAMAAIQAKYQTEEKNLTNQFIERFKENETKINNAAEVIGQAFAKGQTVDQFLLETGADAPEFNELRDSLLNQDDPEKGKLFREARAMVDLTEGTKKVGIVNNEIRISPLHVWDAEGIKSEINELDISDAKKRTAIKAIPQLQQEAAKIEYPFLKENVSEFNSFVKDNNLENVSPERQIAEWKGRNDGWLSNIPKAFTQAGIGLRQDALSFLGSGQTIIGATASIMGAQDFADPFLDAATKTSDEIDRLERISKEIGGPTLVKDLASGGSQVLRQIGFGGIVGFGAKRAGFKPKTVSNIGFGSSVGLVMGQSYGNVLSSAIQTLEKEKIDGGMEPAQARAEAIKEAQLPAALSALIEGTVTVLGGKRGSEAVFREGVDGIKNKINTAAFKAELDKLYPNVARGGRNEFYEEWAAQLAQGFIEQATFNPNLTTSEIVNNAFKAGAIGGTLGVGVEGLKYGFDYMKAPKAMARREQSMASIRQSIADVEREISDVSASSPIGSEFQREYDATLPSDEAANLGGVAVDRTRMNSLQSERQQISELLEDDTISRVARNQLEGKLAAADLAYYNEVLVPMRRNVVNEQMVDQLEAMVVSQQTKDGLTAMAKIANGLGAESLTGRERVAVGITSVGGGRFLPSRKNPMVEVDQAGQAKVTEAGRLMAENVGMVPLVRMIGLSETTRAKQAEMERVVAEAEARKAQQDAKDTAESEEAKRYGPASAEALKQQVATQPPTPEVQSNARLAQLLKEQEEVARLGEEAVARAVETRFIESFRSTISESIIPTAERAATIDLNNFRDVINSIAQEIDKGTFRIELIEQGEFKNILPEQAFTTVVEAFRENPQRALNALRAFGDEVENAVKEFGGGAAGEPEESVEVVSIRRVLGGEQTPEDVTALTEAGLVEVYKDQPILTQAGIDALPEAERPRLTPEARKIQIDTGSSAVVAEAISKGLRIGVDQVGPNVTMPEGWTLDGDIYIPPAPPVAPPVEPPVQPPVTPPVTPPPVAPTAVAITEEQANNAIKTAQEERARKPAQDIGRSRWGPQSIAPKQSIGKTVREALRTASRLNLSKIAQSDPNEIMMQDVAAILAELDMPILDLEPIKSLASLRRKGRPRRWGGGQSVIGLPSTIPMPVEYLNHEAGHTITADQVRRYLPREKFARGKGYLDAINKVIADPKTPEPISRLFSLYVSTIEQLGIADQYFVAGGIAGGKSADASKALAQRAQAKGLIRKDIKPEDFYGLANVEEFVSQTFSEPSFRELLKGLKDPNNPRQSLWQAFVDAIQRILQLPKGTMAAAVVEASIDVGMLVEPDRVRARGRGGVTPAPAPEPEMAPEPETGKTVEMSLEMEKERTFQLLGERLYTAELPKVVVKETTQNAFDAIKDAEETGEIPRGGGVIAYSRKELDVNGEKIVRMMFSDNGGGMTPEILQNAFFTVGGTFKRSGKGSGGFGLAKLGMFMSADRVMVETVRDGVVTTADLSKQELVDKRFNVNVAEDPNRKNGTMVVLEFKKEITRSDGKTVQFSNPYTQFDKLIYHNVAVIDDSYGSYQEELIKLFQNKPSLYTIDELKSRNPINPYTFESFVKEVPNVETFEQDFVIAGAKKPIKVRVAAARLGYKRKNGKAKWNEEIEIAGVNRTLSNYNMSVLSNGLFQFEQTGLKLEPMKLFGSEPLPYSIIVDIDAGGLDAASVAYPFTNSREDFQNGVVKDYVNKLLNDIRVKERQRQFDQEFGLLTDISGGKPRKESPTLYNNTTIVPEPSEQKFLEDLTQAVFDVADDLVVALRKGKEDGILEDTWYKVKSQKGSVSPTGRAEEDSLDYFYGVGISKNWGGVNTSREPVSALVNPIYEERADEYAKTEFGRRILARTIAKTLIHEINHHLHRNEGADFTFFILQNEAYLGEVGAIQSAVDKILPIVNQHSNAIISLKSKFRTAETKDTDNELTGEQYERSSKEPDGQPRTTVVGGDRVVQQPSAEVSPRPTSEEDGEQTGVYLPSSLTVADRQDAGVGEEISFGEALSSSLVENQAQINEEGISRAEGGVAEAITPQQDRDYLDAVERGDYKTAQRILDSGFPPLPEMSQGLKEEMSYWLNASNESGNVMPSWLALKDLMGSWGDRDSVASSFKKELQDIGIKLGYYQTISLEDAKLRASQGLNLGKGYDFKRGDKYYIGDGETPLNIQPTETRDEGGNIIPPSQRFAPPSMRGMESEPVTAGPVITSQQDADYLAAVERGDMEAAQRMVDEAAKRGPFGVASWHGSPTGRQIKKDKSFDPAKLGATTGAGSAKEAFFFAKNIGTSAEYAIFDAAEAPFGDWFWQPKNLNDLLGHMRDLVFGATVSGNKTTPDASLMPDSLWQSYGEAVKKMLDAQTPEERRKAYIDFRSPSKNARAYEDVIESVSERANIEAIEAVYEEESRRLPEEYYSLKEQANEKRAELKEVARPSISKWAEQSFKDIPSDVGAKEGITELDRFKKLLKKNPEDVLLRDVVERKLEIQKIEDRIFDITEERDSRVIKKWDDLSYEEQQKFIDKYGAEIQDYESDATSGSQELAIFKDLDEQSLPLSVFEWGRGKEGEQASVDRYYLKMENPLVKRFEGYRDEKFIEIINKAKADGYDSVIFENIRDGGGFDTIYAVFTPDQIKSADPVTRDDQGNIIPLSQRFQPEQADIRYAPEEEFEIIPEQVEDQIEGTPEAATISVMGQAFQMANEQSAAMGTPEGTLPLETITSAWMNSGRDVETLENAIIRYTNLEPEAAATLAQAIGKQVEIQRGIMEISDAASRRKAEKEAEPEIKPYSFAQRIKEELPPDMRSKVNLAYEVLRNEVSVEEANRVMSGLTLDEAIKATEDMNNGVSMPVRSMMAQIVLRKIMDRRKSTKGKKGKEADYKAVVQAHVEFHDFINDYFKELGQGVQAISRFADLGADGVLLKVRRDIDKAISKHIKNRKGQIDQIKRDVEDADNAAFNAAVKSNKANIDKTARKAGEQEAKKLTIEEQAQKLAIRAAKKVAGEEVRRRQPDPLSDLVNGHLRRYNANFIAEATAMGVSPVTAQAIEDSAKKLRDSRQATKSERERFKEMQDERMRVKKELARENKYIYGPRPTIWENYQDMFSERLARRLMRDPKKKVPPSLLLFTDRLTENLLGFVPEAERQATTQRSFQAMIEDALNNKEKYQEAFNRALEDISLKVMELEVREASGEKISSATYKKAVAAQEFLERLEPLIQQFPVSDKLILRFVNQKMKAMGESLVGRYNDWYRSSRKTRIEIEKALAEKLVADMNVSNADAINLSRAIIKDFRAKAEERREKALARFKKPKEKTKRLAESPLKKFFELVNIGAMTDQDAYEVMAHRFELPTWDPKFAKQIEEMALIIQDMPEGMERRRLTRNMMGEIARRKGFSLSDLGSGFFYSNMLSSVETFLINFYDTLFGNWANGFFSSVADKDFARLNGLISGYRKGWREAVQVFQTGLRINMPRLEEKTPLTVELINYGRKGGVALESTEGMNAIAKTLLESPPAKALNLWKYVTRIMEATDALNYTASSEGQRYAEAAKIAKDEGLEGKAKQKRINQILNLGDDVYQAALKQAEQEGYTGNDAKFRAMEIQDNEIDAELREKSFNRALTDVYRNMPTGLAGFMAAQFNNITMKIANPWFRNAFKLFTAPFVITPTNLFNRWLDYSPYGYKRLFYGSGNLLDKDTPYYVAPPQKGSAEFYTQALKASSSVMVMGLAYGLVKAGLLTLRGMGPSDEEERKQWLDDNNRPHTFSFMGGPQISYQFSPWALVLSWLANYQNWEQYNAKDDASGAERAIVAMTGATSVIMDLPFFAGPAEFMQAIQSRKGDPVATLGKYVEGKMGMVYPNLVRQIDRIFDPTIYDSQGIKGILIDQMPFARRLGTQRVNLFGDPIGEDKPVMDRLVGRLASSPPKPSRESRILAKYDIYPYMPSPKNAKALVDGEEAQMTEEQYNKFVQIVGKDVKKRINDLFDPDAEITEKERERGKKRISQIFERARARAVREVSTY